MVVLLLCCCCADIALAIVVEFVMPNVIGEHCSFEMGSLPLLEEMSADSGEGDGFFGSSSGGMAF